MHGRLTRFSPLALALPLLSIACGPPKAATSPTTSTSASTETETSGGDTDGDTFVTSSEGPDDDGETETETETGDTSLTFVPNDDFSADGCSCDPFQQDCPEGEKCAPSASPAGFWDCNVCVPVTGDRMTGEPCVSGGPEEATDDCDASGVCWNLQEVGPEWVGTCAAFCAGTADDPVCDDPMNWCLIEGDGAVTLCLPTCDPLAQDCDEGVCMWGSTGFFCVLPTQDGGPGEACSEFSDCQGGHVCLDGMSLPACADSQCCAPFCELGGDLGQCDVLPGTSCLPMFEEAPPNLENLGVCIVR